MKQFKIYLNGEPTNRHYLADSDSEAVSMYIKECELEYIDTQGEKPDPDMIYQCGSITAEQL